MMPSSRRLMARGVASISRPAGGAAFGVGRRCGTEIASSSSRPSAHSALFAVGSRMTRGAHQRSFATATAGEPGAYESTAANSSSSSSTSDSGSKQSASAGSSQGDRSEKSEEHHQGEKSESNKQSSSEQEYEEYDTQSADKRVGNPIAWANPTSGPTIDDHSSNRWRNVYPIGFALILLGCLYSRRKNLKKQAEEEDILNNTTIDLGGLGGGGMGGSSSGRFSAPGRFSSPPPSPM